jgi:hypothetical protein
MGLENESNRQRMATTKGGTMATTKKLKALDGFSNVTDNDVFNRGIAVQTNLNGNSRFPNPPVDLTTLKTDLETLSALMAESLDGSKKVTAEKNKQREVVIDKLRLLGRYVEFTCKGDAAMFQTSGFEAASQTKSTTQPLSEKIRKIQHGANSGQFRIWLQADPKALSQELQYAVVTGGVPGPWTTRLVTSIRTPVILSNLTPGSMYAFQARALTKEGYTDWSDSVTAFCT